MRSTDINSRKLHLKYTVIKPNSIVLNITKHLSQKKLKTKTKKHYLHFTMTEIK